MKNIIQVIKYNFLKLQYNFCNYIINELDEQFRYS